MATHSLQHTEPATQRTLLIAGADHDQRTFLAGQLDGDGHTVYEADHTAAVIAKLSAHAVDVLILGDLEPRSEATALLRSMRAGKHPRVHPGLPVITMGADDELTTLRAYENGSDHHLPVGTGYVLLRAIITTVIRRVLEETSVRHLHAGAITVDLTAKTVTVADTPVHVSAWSSNCSPSSPASPRGCSASTSSPAASGAASRSATAPSTATFTASARASPPLAPDPCSSTAGAKAGRSPHRTDATPARRRWYRLRSMTRLAPSTREIDAARPAEVRPADVRPAQVRRTEIRSAEVRPADVRPAQVRRTDSLRGGP
jgi:CheY-like chemotaxis protein